MCIIRLRCKLCNNYVEFKISDDNYFKYINSGKSSDLNLSIDDEILFLKNICNNCRLNRKEN